MGYLEQNKSSLLNSSHGPQTGHLEKG